MNTIATQKILLNRTDDLEKYDGKSLVVLLPGDTCSQVDFPSVDKLPVCIDGCILKIESTGGDNRFCTVKVVQEPGFSPNVSLMAINSTGASFDQPGIQDLRTGYLSQNQVDLIAPNDPLLSKSRDEEYMLIL